MRRNARILVPVLLLLGLGLLPARAEPRAAFLLEDRIPASTLAFASIEDAPAWGPRLEGTAIGQLMRDPEMQAFLTPIAEAVQELVQGGMAQIPPVVMELIGQIQKVDGQVALALIDVDVDREHPHLVMSMDFGEGVDDFAAFLGRMRQELDPEGEQIATMERGGRTWWSVRGAPFPILATTVDTAFVAATDEALLGRVLAPGQEATGMLAGDGEFQHARGRVGGEDLGLVLYGNVESALTKFGDRMPRQTRHIAYALGLDTVKSVAYGMSFKGDGFRDTILVHAPKADHGIVPLVTMEPLTAPRTLDLAPAKTFYWGEGSLPLADLVPRIRSLVATIDPDATEEMDQGLEQLGQMLGVDLEKDVLGGLAGTYGIYAAMPVGGGLYPEVAVAFEVKDAAAYEQVFARLARGIAGLVNEEGEVLADATRTIEYHGVTMHLFEMQEARGDDVVPFTPTWALIGDRLVVTPVPYTMKEIILRVQGVTTGPGLATQRDFQTLMALKPAEAGGVEYINLKGILALLYDTGVPLLQTIAKPNVMEDFPLPMDWALLPPASRVVPHFRSMAEYVTWNEDGLEISIQGPIPMLPLIVGVAAGAGWLTTARMAAAPMPIMEVPGGPGGAIDAEMNLELARIQLEMLYEAVEFFQLESDRLPNSFDELVQAELLGAVPRDPWEGAYRMRRVGEDEFVVESAGPDRAFGTADDVRHEP